ncbi:MAG: glycosyl hydrolase [Solirubrobacterales bacterium]
MRPADAWQIWNEPSNNASAAWGDEAGMARGYAALLTASDDAIKTSANPTARVAMAGLAKNANNFLKLMQADVPSLNSHYDVLDLHAYANSPTAVLNRVSSFRQAADQIGATSKPIWISEVGWDSCLEPDRNYPAKCQQPSGLTTNAAGQRQDLVGMYSLLAKNHAKYDLERVAWYGYRDPDPKNANCSFCPGSGLFYRDGTAKPAWAAYAALAGGKP